jgi:tetrahydromethanopterin S-methyltransferase subunit G
MRALRELVLPEIAALDDTLQRIEKRLDAIERSLADRESS